MAKYDALAARLDEVPIDDRSLMLTFSEVDRIVGGLPPTAHKLRQWWANDLKVQAQAWRSAGWHVDTADLNRQVVRFARGKVGGARAKPPRTRVRPTQANRKPYVNPRPMTR